MLLIPLNGMKVMATQDIAAVPNATYSNASHIV